MTDPIRIPLVEDIEPRLADSSKDGLASNIFYDKNKAGQVFATKRPGITSYISGTGQALGIYTNFGFQLDAVWRQIIWNGTTFLALSSKSMSTSYPDLVISSADGITWTQAYLPLEAQWQGVAWNGSVFCAIAAFSAIAATSADGITWTQRTTGLGSLSSAITAKSGGNFVATAVGTSPYSRYSADGITWSSGNLPSGDWEDVAYCAGPDVFVVISGTAGQSSYYSSSTGATWVSNTLPSGVRFSICASSTKFFTATYNSNIGHISTDGISWTEITLPNIRNWDSCYWTGSHFVVLAEDPATATSLQYVAYSTDGISWVEVALPLPTFGIQLNGYTAIAGNTNMIVVLADGNSFAYSSDDGLTYTQGDLGRYYPYPFSSSL